MAKIIGLLGPSASGKTAIVNQLLNLDDAFERVKTTTTRKIREGEDPEAYNFINKDEFMEKAEKDFFFETSEYAGEYYGTPISSIKNIVGNGKIAIVPIDINGIKSYKERFGEEFVSIFIYRNREDVLNALLERKLTEAEKTKRILSLDEEYSNIRFCDYAIVNNTTVDDAVRKIKKII